MQKLQDLLPQTLDQLKNQNSTENLPKLSQKGVVLANSPESQDKVTAILYQCFLTMNLYGKEAGQFKEINRMFLTFLKDEDPQEVEDAFVYYVQMSSTFPTVADILAIIEGRVSLDKGYYSKLLKRKEAGDRMDQTDLNYIKQYEKQVREGWK